MRSPRPSLVDSQPPAQIATFSETLTFPREKKEAPQDSEADPSSASSRTEGVLDNEEALRLKEQVLDSATNLFEAGVLPREVPESEYVPNYKLLEEYHRKLLPPAPPQIVLRASKKKPRKKTSKKR